MFTSAVLSVTVEQAGKQQNAAEDELESEVVPMNLENLNFHSANELFVSKFAITLTKQWRWRRLQQQQQLSLFGWSVSTSSFETAQNWLSLGAKWMKTSPWVAKNNVALIKSSLAPVGS